MTDDERFEEVFGSKRVLWLESYNGCHPHSISTHKGAIDVADGFIAALVERFVPTVEEGGK